MRKISMFLTVLITSFVVALAGLVASPIATASENDGSISATFASGSSVLTKAQKAAIRKALASSGTDVTYTVTGTAGKLPGVSNRSVKALAKARANAIKAYLVSLGVSKASIATKSSTTEIGVVPKSTGSKPTRAVTDSAGTGSGSGSGAISCPEPTPATTPDAPTSVSGTVASTQSVVSWTAPACTGGATITGYTVTSSPGSLTCTTASTSCTVTGLTNGTAYTFTVRATNSAGTGSASSASSSRTPNPVIISAGAIAGLTSAPGTTPVTTTTAGTGYTGTVTWSGSPTTFAYGPYTATITLTATSGYTLTGVGNNHFTVTGSAGASNSMNSGVVTASWATFTTIQQTIDAYRTINGVTRPVTGATPVTTTTSSCASRCAVSPVTWSPSHATFAASTTYTATITQTPAAGYTFYGVNANMPFIVSGATSVTNPVNSGLLTVVFPATAP